MSHYTGTGGGSATFGMRSLIEQLGNEAVNMPANTIYRFSDAYNSSLGTLLWFRNGNIQDITAADYVETDQRTITMAAAMLAADRLNGIVISDNTGLGGLLGVDRPPAGALVGPYTSTSPFSQGIELFVWLNGLLQVDNVAEDYVSDPPNSQFTFNAAIPGLSTIVSAVIQLGAQGLISRETFLAQGPFPGAVALANAIDRNEENVLVFIDGELQAENFDYILTTPNNLQVTRPLVGANHTVEVIRIAASAPQRWRA